MYVLTILSMITNAISTDYDRTSLNCLCLFLSIVAQQYCSCSSCCGCANVIVNRTTSIAPNAFDGCGGDYQLVNVIITT
jgi:hypothetical protein